MINISQLGHFSGIFELDYILKYTQFCIDEKEYREIDITMLYSILQPEYILTDGCPKGQY